MICPNCTTENREGARFCAKCGAELKSVLPTVPLSKQSAPLSGITPSSPVAPPAAASAAHPATERRTDTKPLKPQAAFAPRPTGAIFGERFIWSGLIFSNENEQRYIVAEAGTPEQRRMRQCPNAVCGAVFTTPETFCTDCATPLEADQPTLVLTETRTPPSANIEKIALQNLSHGSIRAPLASFSETVAGATRYCSVAPQVNDSLPARPERALVLKWGPALARGLDFLHLPDLTGHAVSFNGQIDEGSFGLVDDRAVWTNFSRAHVDSGGAPDAARAADLQALVKQLFKWLTGQTQFAPDPSLAPGFNALFERALTGAGFATGAEFASALEEALNEIAAPQAVDFRIGRRTHPGQVRPLNEDSLLTIEINRTLQSISQPIGVFVVADGMGGHSAGEVASAKIVNTIAAQALTDLAKPTSANQDRSPWLQEAVSLANRAVFDLRQAAGTDMGSTLVMALIDGSKAYVAHVGDSRCYLINDKGIQRLTTDHSLVERLVATNQITPEEARTHPQRNVIYRTIGDKPRVEPDVSAHTLSPGDRLLLCSDGLTGMLEDELIRKIAMERATSPQEACDLLIQAANAAGADDNVTAVMAQIIRL